jgi:hypothetical protein
VYLYGTRLPDVPRSSLHWNCSLESPLDRIRNRNSKNHFTTVQVFTSLTEYHPYPTGRTCDVLKIKSVSYKGSTIPDPHHAGHHCKVGILPLSICGFRCSDWLPVAPRNILYCWSLFLCRRCKKNTPTPRAVIYQRLEFLQQEV